MKKTVLVTGAGRGIGRAIAVALAAQDLEIGINYRQNHEAARQTLDQITESGGSAYLLPFDISDREAARQAIETDMEARGTYWGVVCNAGITADAPFPSMTGENWDSVLRTNLDGFYNLLHPVVMPMVRAKQGGRIITLSSISGLVGNRGQANYAAAKAGIIGATKALSKELAKRRITVNCIAPGIIETDMTAELPRDQVIKTIPMRRYGRPEEVGGLAAYLCSDLAEYITGQVISINGGMV